MKEIPWRRFRLPRLLSHRGSMETSSNLAFPWEAQIGLCALILATAFLATSVRAEVQKLDEVRFSGSIFEDEDVSGVTRLGEDLLALVADEGAKIQILEKKGRKRYKVVETIALWEEDKEADLEAVATEGKTLYAIGSHSRKRLKVRKKLSREENRRRLATLEAEAGRKVVVRWTLDEDGKLIDRDTMHLEDLILNDPILHRFASIPSKENGIDIEGLAVRDGRMYVGFRGPVLRGNFVPVWILGFGAKDYEVVFLNLGGHGVRGMAEVEGGFLVLAGPVGDSPGDYVLYFWDGRDCVPGEGQRACDFDRLGVVETPKGGKAEGVALIDEQQKGWKVLVVYDSAAEGKPTLFQVDRP